MEVSLHNTCLLCQMFKLMINCGEKKKKRKIGVWFLSSPTWSGSIFFASLFRIVVRFIIFMFTGNCSVLCNVVFLSCFEVQEMSAGGAIENQSTCCSCPFEGSVVPSKLMYSNLQDGQTLYSQDCYTAATIT